MPMFRRSTLKPSAVSHVSEKSSTPSSASEFGNTIHVVTEKDYKAAAACLSKAFSKDAVSTYFVNCPDTVGWSEERKWNVHAQIMEALTWFHVKFGLVHAIGDLSKSDTYDAVSLWIRPDADPLETFKMLRTGVIWKFMTSYRKLSKEGRQRMFKEFWPMLESTKEAVLEERESDVWYLVYIGTLEQARGRGLAKKLMQKVTNQADADGRACYLESSNAVNVPIYRKMGFEVCKQITLRRGTEDISLDVMIREPSSDRIQSALPAGNEQQISTEPQVTMV